MHRFGNGRLVEQLNGGRGSEIHRVTPGVQSPDDALVRRDFERLHGSRRGIGRAIPLIEPGIDERVPIGQALAICMELNR